MTFMSDPDTIKPVGKADSTRSVVDRQPVARWLRRGHR
jgi:hypothetical protein